MAFVPPPSAGAAAAYPAGSGRESQFPPMMNTTSQTCLYQNVAGPNYHGNTGEQGYAQPNQFNVTAQQMLLAQAAQNLQTSFNPYGGIYHNPEMLNAASPDYESGMSMQNAMKSLLHSQYLSQNGTMNQHQQNQMQNPTKIRTRTRT